MFMCPLCQRDVPLTRHHLVPQHKGGENQVDNYMMLCRDCHSQLHTTYDNAYLRDHLDTAEKVLADPKMQRFAKFAAKQSGRIKRRRSRQHGDRPLMPL